MFKTKLCRTFLLSSPAFLEDFSFLSWRYFERIFGNVMLNQFVACLPRDYSLSLSHFILSQEVGEELTPGRCGTQALMVPGFQLGLTKERPWQETGRKREGEAGTFLPLSPLAVALQQGHLLLRDSGSAVTGMDPASAR